MRKIIISVISIIGLAACLYAAELSYSEYNYRTGKVVLSDGSKADIINLRGSVDVEIQDQYWDKVSVALTRELDTATILTDTELYDRTIDLETTGFTPVADNMLCLKQGERFYQSYIVSVTSLGGNQYRLTMDSPLDYPFTTAGSANIRSDKANVEGTGASPVIFATSPRNLSDTQKWDIYEIRIIIRDATVMDDAKFGGIAALTNGVIFRFVDGDVNNFANIKNNQDFVAYGATKIYSDTNPVGSYGLEIIYHIKDVFGTNFRLSAQGNDYIQMLIQDDLTGLLGHTVEQ